MSPLKSFKIIIVTILFLALPALSFGDENDVDDDDTGPLDSANPLADEDKGTILPPELTFQVLNRTEIEKSCDKLVRCWSSDKDLWICGSDDRVYQNPGVLVCAQKCNSSLELEIFCKMNPWSPDFIDDRDHCANCKTRSTVMATEALAISADIAKGETEIAEATAQSAAEAAANARANPSDPDAAAAAAETATAAAEAAARAKMANDAVAEATAKVQSKSSSNKVQ